MFFGVVSYDNVLFKDFSSNGSSAKFPPGIAAIFLAGVFADFSTDLGSNGFSASLVPAVTDSGSGFAGVTLKDFSPSLGSDGIFISLSPEVIESGSGFVAVETFRDLSSDLGSVGFSNSFSPEVTGSGPGFVAVETFIDFAIELGSAGFSNSFSPEVIDGGPDFGVGLSISLAYDGSLPTLAGGLPVLAPPEVTAGGDGGVVLDEEPALNLATQIGVAGNAT